jgi:hypothetical protein
MFVNFINKPKPGNYEMAQGTFSMRIFIYYYWFM